MSNGNDILRDERGRFTAGSGGGPGRPTRATEERYKLAFNGSLTVERFVEVVEALYEKAIDGDTQAAKILLDHSLGKPREKLEVSRGDSGEEFRVAGCRPEELDRQMLQRLALAIQARRDRARLLPVVPSLADAKQGQVADTKPPFSPHETKTAIVDSTPKLPHSVTPSADYRPILTP